MKRKELLVSLSIVAMATAAPSAFAQAVSHSSTAQAPPIQAAARASAPAASDAVATLQKACLPILRGAKANAAARSAGFQLRNGGWVRPIAGNEEIDLDPPDAANPHVCTLTLSAAPSDGTAMRSALGAWAAAQRPPLAAVGLDQNVPGAAQDWVTSTWSAQTSGGAESMVLTQPQTPPGQSATQSQRSTLMLSLTPT